MTSDREEEIEKSKVKERSAVNSSANTCLVPWVLFIAQKSGLFSPAISSDVVAVTLLTRLSLVLNLSVDEMMSLGNDQLAVQECERTTHRWTILVRSFNLHSGEFLENFEVSFCQTKPGIGSSPLLPASSPYLRNMPIPSLWCLKNKNKRNIISDSASSISNTYDLKPKYDLPPLGEKYWNLSIKS